MGPSHPTNLLLLATTLLAPTTSAQQCYFARGMLAPAEVVPCFKTSLDAGEASACCQAGDFCLTDGACFDPRSGTTYMYGCTDDTYSHSNCPRKCGLDTDKSPWVGMIKCHDDEADEDERDDPPYTWACNHPDTCGRANCPNVETWPSTVFAQPSVTDGCDGLATVEVALVVMSWVLSGLSSLPSEIPSQTTRDVLASEVTGEASSRMTSAGGSKSGLDAVATRSAAQASSTPEQTGPAPAQDDTSSSGGGLSTGASIGIGLGAGLAVLLVGSAAWILLHRRKRRADEAAAASEPHVTTSEAGWGPGNGPAGHSPPAWVMHDKHDRSASELGSMESPSPPSQYGGFGLSPRIQQGRSSMHHKIAGERGQIHELAGGQVPGRLQ